MQTLRFNPFGQIHKGLRALLYDTALLLQHTDFKNEKEIAEAVARVQLVNRLFARHAHTEDSQVFPMMAPFAPDIVQDFESQHEIDHSLSLGLERCLALFTETNNPAQNCWAGNELLQSFNAFLAFNVEHMKKEETIVNACLWQHFSDADLLKKVQEISATVHPEENNHFVYWMLKGLAAHEIIDWYSAIQAAAPPPVFQFYSALAEETLPTPKWEQVKEGLRKVALPQTA